ncbi:MAG: NAD(P)H-hydrate dehydratase [Lachnospiraceae bacterium]|nr:NAD(P)H-hydrate dehydratase [Lachnospiraceae bacterium]
MKYLVTGKEMKLLDQNTTDAFSVPAQVLMEQAAMVFVQKLFSIGRTWNKVLILCGNGNNGADGVAVARLLNQGGTEAVVCRIGEGNESELMKLQSAIYQSYHFPEVSWENVDIEAYDCIVDAIFGIGLSRPIRGNAEQVISRANEADAYRVALDMPSGISADSGEVLGIAFLADATVTFSFGKIGQYLWPGNEYCGNVMVAPMGITQDSWLERKPRFATLEQEDLSLLPRRSAHSNKGTYGKLLIVAGSVDMAGNAALCAKAAYRMGVGIVKIFTPVENRQALFSLVPEAILSTYDKTVDEKKLIEDLKWADALVIGPGIGTGENGAKMLDVVLENTSVPVLLDADALNIMARSTERFLLPHTDMVITPHLGEMARLTGDAVSYIQNNLTEVAENFANQYDLVCVLKDFRTVTAIPYGLTYINTSGNHGMATAGSGDVLSGVIGSLLAQGMCAKNAAPLGVFVHGLAGDICLQRQSAASVMAGDLADAIREIAK